MMWDEVTSPYQTIWTVELLRQDSFVQERRVFSENYMRLDPWRGLQAHRPLGSINRLRKYVYGRGQKKRDGLNEKSTKDIANIDEIQ